MELRLLDPEFDEHAARLMSDAFLDDPAYVAIGPRDSGKRWMFLLRLHRQAVRMARRFGGPLHAAMDGDRLAGVSVVFDEGTYPPPPVRSFSYLIPVLASGLGPAMRGLPVSALMARHHVRQPHVYLEVLCAHPLLQRRGAGRALLSRIAGDADTRGLPTYLETTKPENVAYYQGFGFEVQDEVPLRGDARMWFMLRPAKG
jgi:GNAT superfamily N-acetyltransferase